jgi:hypothetical protein
VCGRSLAGSGDAGYAAEKLAAEPGMTDQQLDDLFRLAAIR